MTRRPHPVLHWIRGGNKKKTRTKSKLSPEKAPVGPSSPSRTTPTGAGEGERGVNRKTNEVRRPQQEKTGKKGWEEKIGTVPGEEKKTKSRKGGSGGVRVRGEPAPPGTKQPKERRSSKRGGDCTGNRPTSAPQKSGLDCRWGRTTPT